MKRISMTALVIVALAAPLSARNEHDDEFADAMIMHHRHGIEMARVAIDKAQHAELREFAQRIINDRQRDIEQLWTMRDTSEDPARGELADMPGMVLGDIAWLKEKSGKDFDVAFVTAMTDHHLNAVRMARDEIEKGSDPKPRAKAREIAAKQSKERQTLLDWRQAWN